MIDQVGPPLLRVFVPGTPVQQGNHARGPHGGTYEKNKKLKPWRTEVTEVLQSQWQEQGQERAALNEPVRVDIQFVYARPDSHYGTGRNTGVLKASAPLWKATMPDIDKLVRAILDCLTFAAVVRDDSRVVEVRATKAYGTHPGAGITVWTADDVLGGP